MDQQSTANSQQAKTKKKLYIEDPKNVWIASINNAKIYDKNKIYLQNFFSFFHNWHQSNNFDIFVVSFISKKMFWYVSTIPLTELEFVYKV